VCGIDSGTTTWSSDWFFAAGEPTFFQQMLDNTDTKVEMRGSLDFDIFGRASLP
jgi:hypothetical protein